jgi:O-antigen/teichoic acid export membrane protein
MALPLSILTAVLVVAYPLADLEPATKVIAFLLVAWSPVMSTYGRAARMIIAGRGDLRKMSVLTLIPNTVTITVYVLAWLTGHLTVPVAAATLAAANFGGYVYCWWQLRGERETSGSRFSIAELLRYGGKALPGTLSDLANNRLDQIIILPILGAKELGFYAVAVGINFVLLQLGISMAVGTYSRVSVGDRPGRHSPAARQLRRTLIFTGTLGIALMVVIPVVIPLLYGNAFQDSVGPALVLVPGTVFYCLYIVSFQIANALNVPQKASTGSVVALVVTVVGLLVFVPRYGIIAAALVSTVAYVVRFGITAVLLRSAGVYGLVPTPRDVTDTAREVWRRLPFTR